MARKKILISMDEDLVEALDRLSASLDISRSRALEACVESSLDDFAWVGFVGATPRQLHALGAKLKTKKQLKYGSLVVDVSKFWQRMKREGIVAQRD